jgi:hypothetical protein
MSFVGGSLSLKGDKNGVKKRKKSKDGKKSKPEKEGSSAPALADHVPAPANDQKEDIELPPAGHKCVASSIVSSFVHCFLALKCRV